MHIVITYTPATPDYNPRVEGFRLAAEEGLQVAFDIDTTASDCEVLDAILAQTDPATRRPFVAGVAGQIFSAAPYAPQVGVGDTVSIDGNLMAREHVGWMSPSALLLLNEDEEEAA